MQIRDSPTESLPSELESQVFNLVSFPPSPTTKDSSYWN